MEYLCDEIQTYGLFRDKLEVTQNMIFKKNFSNKISVWLDVFRTGENCLDLSLN